MRIIFLSLFLISTLVSFCQDEKPPSKAEIKQQMQQAITDAKKQRSELQKEIADAKANNEDAESIKHMEDLLRSLDAMIAGLENSNPNGNLERKILPKSTTQETPFISPFTPIPVKLPVIAPTEKEAKDQLLWFKGKKIDANTLITTDRRIVQYDWKSYKLTIQPDKNKDTTYFALVKMLSQVKKKEKGVY